ncbi:MAG: alpha/beta hydrolase [Hyphomonas sp.]
MTDPTISSLDGSPDMPGISGRDITYSSGDGLRLYAAAYGREDARTAVLCMHGFTRNHKDFEPMISAVGSAYRFLAVDVRGRGRSDRDPTAASYAPPAYAADMVALLDQEKIEKVVLIGTSMGGVMSMILSRMIPEKIAGIVLNDVGPEVNMDGLRRIGAYVGGGDTFANWAEATAAVRATQESAVPGLSDADWEAFARRTCVETDDGRIAFDYDPGIRVAFDQKPPGVRLQFLMWRIFGGMKKFPLLVVRGANSDILTERTAARMMRRHKGAKLVTVAGRGHAPLLDEPEAVAAISAFLAAHAAD